MGVEGSRGKRKGKEGRPEDLSNEIVFTVHTIAQISGKSYPNLFRAILLLKLSPEIRMEISDLSATTTQPQAGKGYDLDGVMSELEGTPGSPKTCRKKLL
jgi:hypothetical protein